MNLERTITKFLEKKGWHTYYNPKYWVHQKLVKDPSRQDYTDYGMDLESAFIHEAEDLPPFASMGMPALSQMFSYNDRKEILKYYFEIKEVKKDQP